MQAALDRSRGLFENIVAGMAKQNMTTWKQYNPRNFENSFRFPSEIFVGDNVFCELLRFLSHYLKKTANKKTFY
jgi:hypothetical protein